MNLYTVKPLNYGLLTSGNSFIWNKFQYINLFPCNLIVNNVSEQRKFPYPEHGNLLNVKQRKSCSICGHFRNFLPFSSTERGHAIDQREEIT